MKRIKAIFTFLTLSIPAILSAQNDSIPDTWTYQDCIDYAKSKNITIQKSVLSQEQNKYNLEQSKANQLPSVTGSASTSFSWAKEALTENNSFADREQTNSTSFDVNADLTLFNGFKLKKQIKQAELNLKSSEYNTQTQEDDIELSILNAYLEILYAKENIKNSQSQIEATKEELNLAKERMDIGVISKSDYLQIKSELASEKATLANYKSTLTIDKLTLMQLMEIPVTDDFEVEDPNIEEQLLSVEKAAASDVYQQSLKIKAEIKQAELDVKSAEYDIDIAKADYLPTVSMSAGVGTGWSDQISGYSYSSQLKNKLTPTLGLNVSIPIFQNKTAKTNVALAKISVKEAQLDEQETKNNLRKEIEQACADLFSAKTQYEANLEEYNSTNESYEVAVEKYKEGLINSVDFLSIKTDKIESESNLLQAKYKVIFNSKIVDFYTGKIITF